MFTKALIILASISAALAVPFITRPVSDTTFRAGQNASVRWQENDGRPTLEEFGLSSFGIYVGNQLQQTLLQSLSPGFNVSKERELVFIPDETIGPDSGEYFIRMESLSLKVNNTAPAQAFSAKFRLTGMKGAFSDAVRKQIEGQSTAPVPSHTASKPATSSPTTSVTSSKVAVSSTPSNKATGAAAESIVFHGNWIGSLFALFVVTMF